MYQFIFMNITTDQELILRGYSLADVFSSYPNYWYMYKFGFLQYIGREYLDSK